MTEVTTRTDSAESATAGGEVAAAPDVALESRTVDLDRLAAHPGNPRKDLGDLTELAESIRAQGVLQPPVVLPAERVAAVWPDHAPALADVDWVVLMGARRRAAAIAAGRIRLPVLIRRDPIADDRLAQLDAMVAENTARQPLTPVEEARAFAEQEAAGRFQRHIAARAGCSQSHVSKRLKLLKLPASMLAELETGPGRTPDDEDRGDGARKPLQIKDALAYVDAAGDDQFVALAAYKLRQQNRHHWSPADLVREVRREQQRQKAVEAATKKLAAEGTRVITSAREELGNSYWDRQLRGHKAIAAARKAGTVLAEINHHGQVTYYSTAGKKPKKADNRSDDEEQRITDERERRKAMTARAEAAAGLAARPPKLPEAAAADIVDAWLWAPGNDLASLAHKWLLAAGVGPDPDLPAYQWWEQVRTGDWPTRVHAAHALALARHEIQTRATYRSWNQHDAAWLARLVEQAGYLPSEWEQSRLDAIGREPAPPAKPERASLTYDHDDNQCWVIYFDFDVDDPAAWAEDLEDPDTVEDAKAWAEQLLHDEYDVEVTGWTDGELLPGYPAHIAVFAGTDNLGAEPVDQAGTDPAPALPAEYRLLYSSIDGSWMLLRDDEHLADHDGLHADDLDAACDWAGEAVGDDCGHQVQGWQSRTGIGEASVEHVAEFAAGQLAR